MNLQLDKPEDRMFLNVCARHADGQHKTEICAMDPYPKHTTFLTVFQDYKQQCASLMDEECYYPRVKFPHKHYNQQSTMSFKMEMPLSRILSEDPYLTVIFELKTASRCDSDTTMSILSCSSSSTVLSPDADNINIYSLKFQLEIFVLALQSKSFEFSDHEQDINDLTGTLHEVIDNIQSKRGALVAEQESSSKNENILNFPPKELLYKLKHLTDLLCQKPLSKEINIRQYEDYISQLFDCMEHLKKYCVITSRDVQKSMSGLPEDSPKLSRGSNKQPGTALSSSEAVSGPTAPGGDAVGGATSDKYIESIHSIRSFKEDSACLPQMLDKLSVSDEGDTEALKNTEVRVLPSCQPRKFGQNLDFYTELHKLSERESKGREFKYGVECVQLMNDSDKEKRKRGWVKFEFEVLRFICGCLNEGIESTLHLGIADENSVHALTVKKHPCEIVGLQLTEDQKVKFKDKVSEWIKNGFQSEVTPCVQKCIKDPIHFIPVFAENGKETGRCVIEIDVSPQYEHTNGLLFCVKLPNLNEPSHKSNKKTAKAVKDEYECYTRDGSCTSKMTIEKICKHTNMFVIRRDKAVRRKEEQAQPINIILNQSSSMTSLESVDSLDNAKGN